MQFSVIFISTLCLCAYLVRPINGAPAPAPAPSPANDEVQVLKYENDNIGIDGYNFAFETSDGVSRKESATLKNAGTDHEAISVQGTVSWVGPDGSHYTLNYLADENGFQPEGAHLPVAPES